MFPVSNLSGGRRAGWRRGGMMVDGGVFRLFVAHGHSSCLKNKGRRSDGFLLHPSTLLRYPDKVSRRNHLTPPFASLTPSPTTIMSYMSPFSIQLQIDPCSEVSKLDPREHFQLTAKMCHGVQ